MTIAPQLDFSCGAMIVVRRAAMRSDRRVRGRHFLASCRDLAMSSPMSANRHSTA